MNTVPHTVTNTEIAPRRAVGVRDQVRAT